MQPLKIFPLFMFCLLISFKALEIKNDNKLNIEKPNKWRTIFPSKFASEDTKKFSKYQLKNNVKTFSYNHNGNLLIDAKMNTDKKKLSINFASNYANSAEAKYYIFIGPKNNKITLNDFNDPNFLLESVNQNSNQIKIWIKICRSKTRH